MSVLEAIAREVAGCQRCDLAKTRNLTVPGEGNPEADIMLIGEAPGWHENQQGRPFVGAAGQFLQELLQPIGLQRSEVFIANVVKCRPPQNRDPLPEEVVACSDYLERQIAAIKPKLIVTLGRYSMGRFFPAGKGIRELHGTTVVKNGVLCFAMYHPAAALHQPSLRRTLEQDMLKIPPLVSVAAEIQSP
ncbi:MAG TPA: uracil-DNA glycosylase, partial [Chloroflexota bacterium]|nr:uracil-DNA glycosylase [Chloroflexota bacterium]